MKLKVLALFAICLITLNTNALNIKTTSRIECLNADNLKQLFMQGYNIGLKRNLDLDEINYNWSNIEYKAFDDGFIAGAKYRVDSSISSDFSSTKKMKKNDNLSSYDDDEEFFAGRGNMTIRQWLEYMGKKEWKEWEKKYNN